MHHQYRLLKNIPVMISGHGTSGSGGIPCVDGVHFGRICLYHVINAVHDAMAAGCSGYRAVKLRNGSSDADDKTDAVDGIGRTATAFRPPKMAVAAADDADDEALVMLATAMNLLVPRMLEMSKICSKTTVTGVQDDRQVEDGVHNNDYQREHRLVPFASAPPSGTGWSWCPFSGTGAGSSTPDQQGEHRADLPCDRAHVGLPALAVQTDELFSGKVGQQQRTGDDYARQAAAWVREATSAVAELLVAGLPCGK